MHYHKQPANQYLLLALLLFFAIFLSSCFNLLGDSSDMFIKSVANTNHTKKAIIFLREGGATSSVSYQVSVMDYSNDFDTTKAGNTFTVDSDHGKAALSKTSIVLTWLSNSTLQIAYDKNLRTFIQQNAIDGTNVIYKKY